MSAVLIVEDEPGLRQGLVEVVGAMGHEAWPAAGIGEARTALAAHPIDCVVLDIRLRDGDGLDYLAELRDSVLCLETTKGERFWFTYDLLLGMRVRAAQDTKDHGPGFSR